ncbi:hypothetical protein BASA81_002994 [Batrachochytrium salamandrivorans]|nr:hypothetical protein BASA81_002994 [Batrachochytrium salamandrivorans]
MKRFDHLSRALVCSDGIALDYRSLSPQQSGHPAFAFDDFSSMCAGSGRFAFGDVRGGVTLTSSLSLRPKRFDLLDKEENPALVFLGIAGNLLICCTANSLIKLFRLSVEQQPQQQQPPLLPDEEALQLVGTWQVRKRLGQANLAIPPTALAHSSKAANLLHIALGFSDGQTVWLRAVSTNNNSFDFSQSWFDFSQPVTALGFVQNDDDDNHREHLFVCGRSKVSSLDSELKETVLNGGEFGCEVGCGVAHGGQFFVTCREDRVQFFTPDIAGSLYSTLGSKSLIQSLGDNLVVVSQAAGGEAKILQVLDLSNKFIAHEFPLLRGDSVCFLATDESTSCVFVLTKMKKLWRLRENPIETRLNDLLKRNLYSIAIRLAKTSNKCDLNYIADLHRRYAEHLYEKKNFEDSVTQFCLTIGRIEPSYVIRRFLDSNQVANLVVYLEALHHTAHTQFAPSPGHTTLLLTCYSKLKQEDKICAFIRNAPQSSPSLDVPAALSMLKDTGKLQPALQLAKARNQHDWYVTTLLEGKAKDGFVAALEHLTTIQGFDLFLQHAFVLATKLPNECLDFAKKFSDQGLEERFLDAFLCDSKLTSQYCLFLFSHEFTTSGLSPKVWNTCLEVALREGDFAQSQKICSLLLSSSLPPGAQCDLPFALFLLRQHGDFQSLFLMLERLNRFEDLLKYKLEEREWDGDYILHLACTRFADDAQVWKTVLAFFANRESVKREFYLRECLQHIELNQVLPALMVLDILSECTLEVHLGVICAYLVSQMQRAVQQSDADKLEVQRLREDTEKMHHERQVLENEPRVFNATTCSLTGAALELPVVHFLSGNTYNLASLPTTSSTRLQDPKCYQDQHSVLDIAKGLARRRADVDEEFFSELQLVRGGEAGFSFVADYFGKCLFDEDEEGGGDHGEEITKV